MTTLNQTVEKVAQPENAQAIKAQRDALLAAVVELEHKSCEAQRNAPDCDTLSAGYVFDVCNNAIAQVRATITVIGENALPAEFRSENMYGGNDEEFAAKSAAFRKYCDDNSIHYYARSREDFSSWCAFDEAAKAGCTKLLMEDMS
jgi:hypothetical protein